jgi:hypothetical protein
MFQSLNGIDSFLGESVFLLIVFSFLDHLIDLFLRKSTSEVINDDLLLDASAEVFSRDRQDTIGIYFEGGFQLGFTCKSGGYSLKRELV